MEDKTFPDTEGQCADVRVTSSWWLAVNPQRAENSAARSQISREISGILHSHGLAYFHRTFRKSIPGPRKEERATRQSVPWMGVGHLDTFHIRSTCQGTPLFLVTISDE